MSGLLAKIRRGAQTVTLCFLLALATPAIAQQSGLVTPDADAVKEQQLLQELYRIQGRVTIPDAKSSVLEQPAGRLWRMVHEVYVHWVGAIAIIGIFCLLAMFYLWRGSMKYEGGPSGRKMLRFNAFERFVHWMTASCFVILALSGLNITFGKRLLLPYMGLENFSTWSATLKYLHNFLSFPFTIGVVLMFLMWIANNIPTHVDIEWIKRGGGMLGGGEPPASRFNAGEKLIFWIVVIGGGIAAITGYILMFPFYGTDIVQMQLAQAVHGLVGVLYIAAMLVHIYMGTIGMKGAFEGMGKGYVDINWMKAHHSLWYEKVATTGPEQIPTESAATPAE
jgi:formate dehydrogenase subunit gamma